MSLNISNQKEIDSLNNLYERGVTSLFHLSNERLLDYSYYLSDNKSLTIGQFYFLYLLDKFYYDFFPLNKELSRVWFNLNQKGINFEGELQEIYYIFKKKLLGYTLTFPKIEGDIYMKGIYPSEWGSSLCTECKLPTEKVKNWIIKNAEIIALALTKEYFADVIVLLKKEYENDKELIEEMLVEDFPLSCDFTTSKGEYYRISYIARYCKETGETNLLLRLI